MTLKDDFVSSNKIVKVAFVIYLLAAFFSSISVTEGSWGKRQDEKSPYGSTYYRLWSVCRDDADEDLIKACFFSLIGTATAWMAATQALVVLGFFGTSISFGIVVMYIWTKICRENKEAAFIAGVISIVTGILYLIGCIVFGVNWFDKYPSDEYMHSRLDYGFGLSIVASIFEMIGGIIMFVSTRATAP